MAKIEIDHGKWDADDCAECVDSCPMAILQLEGSKMSSNHQKNVTCAKCV